MCTWTPSVTIVTTYEYLPIANLGSPTHKTNKLMKKIFLLILLLTVAFSVNIYSQICSPNCNGSGKKVVIPYVIL